ncbi:MAG: porin [Alphaproteobacteria bacterium]|nr:porin [Alphaproteobacteria bacterium]
MKKHFLSAALFSTVAAFSAPAFAQTATVEAFDQPIELQLGGYMTWYGTYGNQHKSTLTWYGLDIGNYNHADIMGSAEIYFSGKTTLQNGIEIGAMVQLKAGTDPDTSNHVIDESYLTVDSKTGRIILGNVKNVSYQMSVTAPTASSVGEQESDFTRVLIAPAMFAYNKATYALLDDVSTKVSYITPTFSDLTFGVSLMPGNKTKGKDNNDLLIPDGGIKLFKYGADATALYQHDFGKFNVEASAVYTLYKPNLHANSTVTPALGLDAEKEKDIKEYGTGLNIGIGNWTIGGSYHYTNMSKKTAEFLIPYANVARGAAWDAGVKFTAGPIETSATIFQSRADSIMVDGKKDIYTQYQLSGKYNIISGVSAFIDLAYLNFKSASDIRALSNKGPAAAIGMNLNF